MSEMQGTTLTRRPKPVVPHVIKVFIATRCQGMTVTNYHRDRHVAAEYVNRYVNKWLFQFHKDYCPPHVRVEVDYLVPDILPESATQLTDRLLQRPCLLILPALPSGEAEDVWLNILNVLAEDRQAADKPKVVFFLSESIPDPPPDTPSHWNVCRGVDELVIITRKMLIALSPTV